MEFNYPGLRFCKSIPMLYCPVCLNEFADFADVKWKFVAAQWATSKLMFVDRIKFWDYISNCRRLHQPGKSHFAYSMVPQLPSVWRSTTPSRFQLIFRRHVQLLWTLERRCRACYMFFARSTLNKRMIVRSWLARSFLLVSFPKHFKGSWLSGRKGGRGVRRI